MGIREVGVELYDVWAAVRAVEGGLEGLRGLGGRRNE